MISLLIVATNNYVQFLYDLIPSIDRYFIHPVTIHIFTNKTGIVADMFANREDILIHEVQHHQWPGATLYRFHFFKQYLSAINGDYIFYVDADTKFVNPVGDIISDRVAVEHCGYVGERGTYETDHKSTSYVADNEGKVYYGGGFWGFSYFEFVRVINKAIYMIDEDKKNNIIPIWHDESVINRYLIDNPPTLVLSPSYHYPENNNHIYNKWGDKNKYKTILLLLDKNHKQIR